MCPAGAAAALPDEDLSAAYLAHARRAFPSASALAGTRVAVDCSNGATTGLAPRLLRELGFDVVAFGCEPDGRNINLDCGSTHPEFLVHKVVEEGCSGRDGFRR